MAGKNSKDKATRSKKKRVSRVQVVCNNAGELASEFLSDAWSLILEFEDDRWNRSEEEVEELKNKLDGIRDSLDDCTDDGWLEEDAELLAISEKLLDLNVVWPDFLPWHGCDTISEDEFEELENLLVWKEDNEFIANLGKVLCKPRRMVVSDLVQLAKKHFAKEIRKYNRRPTINYVDANTMRRKSPRMLSKRK